MLILPEQIIPICERLTSLAVESVVNKLLFLGKFYEVKCHNLGLISTNLQLKQVINNIHQTASNHTRQESGAFVLGFRNCFRGCKTVGVSVEEKQVWGSEDNDGKAAPCAGKTTGRATPSVPVSSREVGSQPGLHAFMYSRPSQLNAWGPDHS